MSLLGLLYMTAHFSYVQVCTLHNAGRQGINQQIFNRKSTSRKIMQP